MHSSAVPGAQLSINGHSLKSFLDLVYGLLIHIYWSALGSRLDSIGKQTMAVVLQRLSERTLSTTESLSDDPPSSSSSPSESPLSMSPPESSTSSLMEPDEVSTPFRSCPEGLRLSLAKVGQKRNLREEEEEESRDAKSPVMTFDSLPPVLLAPSFERDLAPARSCPKSLIGDEPEGSSDRGSGPLPIEADEVAELLLSNSSGEALPQLLLIDCRSFMKYNSNRIAGAVNACCTNPTIRKRFRDGKMGVAELISGPGDKARFREAASRPEACLMVVYDDATSDPTRSSSLSVVAARLEDRGLRVRFLRGGLDEFSSRHARLCTRPDPVDQRPLLFSPTSPYVDAAIDSTVATEILDHLWLGNERDAADLAGLESRGITHVLNVSASVPLFCEAGRPGAFCSLRIPASDSGSQNIKQYFEMAIRFIDEARSSGGKVLVHCQAGVSRSPTITMAYLMARCGHRSLDAFGLVKAKRSIVSPNINFMGQLLEFESRLAVGGSD